MTNKYGGKQMKVTLGTYKYFIASIITLVFGAILYIICSLIVSGTSSSVVLALASNLKIAGKMAAVAGVISASVTGIMILWYQIKDKKEFQEYEKEFQECEDEDPKDEK